MELLAPAGSPAAMRGAVQNGADAVYLGAKAFSARSGAANFTQDELREAVRYCRIRDVKVFLAVNTLVFDRELPELYRLIELATQIGVDACIVQDLGAARLIRHASPEMKLHASTQMTVHSLEGVRFLENAGFARVVLSRELSRSEMREICENCTAEIEVFVHGALCVCYSGKCLMSSMIGGRSGNRGQCAQPCRLPFSAGGGRGYLLSPKDLCLIDDLADMASFPVTSVKIEGRMKSPEYVSVVTSVYRKAIDTGQAEPCDKDRLKEIFCRGGDFTRAYYGGVKTADMMNTQSSNEGAGKNASANLIKEAAKTYAEDAQIKKIPVDIRFYKNGENAVLEMQKGELTAFVTCETGDEPPLPRERALLQLKKLGKTPFYPKCVSAEKDIRIKISQINEMRRSCCKELENVICETRAPMPFHPYKYSQNPSEAAHKIEICAQVLSLEQAHALAGKVGTIYAPLHLHEHFKKLSEKSRIYAVLPVIIKNERERLAREIKNALSAGAAGLVCESTDALAAAREYGCEIIGGIGLNVTNSESVRFLEEQGLERVAASPELSSRQIRAMAEGSKALIEAVIYGRLPLMITENSFKGYGNALTDRTGAVFPLREASGGRSVIYNSRPLYLADKDYDPPARGILFFTIESARECNDILEKYKNGSAADFPFTRGYF